MLKEFYNNTPTIFLAHGFVGEVLGKTVNGVLMHSDLFNIVAIVDQKRVGQDTAQICPGVTKTVPIVKEISEALEYEAKVMILMGPPTQDKWEDIKLCIRKKMDIINSAFVFLSEIPEIVSLAAEYDVRLIDLRNTKRYWRRADGSILNIKAKVVYLAGTDCGLGKRTAAAELTREARKRGINAAMAGTGQTGEMIGCDDGIIIDACLSEYTIGAVEQLIVNLDKRGFDLIFLEGQAGITHPASTNAISLLMGGNPHAVVLVHDPSRKFHYTENDTEWFRIKELGEIIRVVEMLSLPASNKFKVVALATRGEENIQLLRSTQNLPVAEPRQEGGPAIILDAVLAHLETEYNWKPTGC